MIIIEVPRDVAIESSKRLVVDSIWKIANIELTRGVTFPQTQEIYEGRSPKNIDVETVVVINNLKHAWQFLFENIDYPLDYQLIAEYNKIVGASHFSDPGKLRSEFVFISGTNKPDIPTYESIKEEIGRIKKIEDPIDRGMEMLFSVSRGQWFNNGNKRTAQMITNHILLQSNSAVLAIPLDKQEDFTEELINFYKTSDNRSFKSFLLKHQLRCCQVN
jgi:prophage maintenance system killer protein